MIILLFSIVSSSLLMILFKYYGKMGIDNLEAITVNYLVATGLGFYMSNVGISIDIADRPWAIYAILLGALFILMFYLMAMSTQKVGVAISTVAVKMSLVIPVVAGVFLYSETITPLRSVGIVLALLAVGLVVKPPKGMGIDPKYILLPVIMFLVSGFLDSLFKFCQIHFLNPEDVPLFSACLFATAGMVGLLILTVRKLKHGQLITYKGIVAGVALGVPNYFSIYFLIMALQLPNVESTVVFPINNVGVVITSTIFALLLFRERLSKLNWAGFGVAIISIILVAFG